MTEQIKEGDIVKIKSDFADGIGRVTKINKKSDYKYEVDHFEESGFSHQWSHKEKVVYPAHNEENCKSELLYHKRKGWICPWCEL